MDDNDLITRREVELVLLKKGQETKRYKWGETWELNFSEIREALSEYQSEIVRCKYCRHSTEWCGDKRRCFLWNENGIDVFEDGYCSCGRPKESR